MFISYIILEEVSDVSEEWGKKDAVADKKSLNSLSVNRNIDEIIYMMIDEIIINVYLLHEVEDSGKGEWRVQIAGVLEE